MRLLFTTDLHGSKWKYDQLLGLAKEHHINVVINGGDLLPKHGDLWGQKYFISDYLDNHFAKFEKAKIMYLSCLGNDDLKSFDELFQKICDKYKYVFNLAQQKCAINDYEFIGFNFVTDYPFRLKDRCRMDAPDFVFPRQLGTGLLSAPTGFDELRDWFSYAKGLLTIEEELEKLPKPMDFKKSIYIIHMPPANLGLDECANREKVGSKAVYKFLNKYQPLFSFHGHIHESPQMSKKWHANIGDTICVQPGQLADLTYVLADLNSLKISKETQTPANHGSK